MIDPYDIFSISAVLNGVASLTGFVVQWKSWKRFEARCIVTQGIVTELKRGRDVMMKLWIHPLVRFPLEDSTAEPRRFNWSTNPPRWLVGQTVEVRHLPNAPEEFFLDRCHFDYWLVWGLLANAALSLLLGVGSWVAIRLAVAI